MEGRSAEVKATEGVSGCTLPNIYSIWWSGRYAAENLEILHADLYILALFDVVCLFWGSGEKDTLASVFYRGGRPRARRLWPSQ